MAEKQHSKRSVRTSLKNLKERESPASDFAPGDGPHTTLSINQVNDVNRLLEQARGILFLASDKIDEDNDDPPLSAAIWTARELVDQVMDIIDPRDDGARFRPDAWRAIAATWRKADEVREQEVAAAAAAIRPGSASRSEAEPA